MNKICLYLGTDHKKHIAHLAERCLGLAKQGKFDAFMVILPTSRWAEFFRQQLFARQGNWISAPLILGYNQAIDVLYSRLVDSPWQEIKNSQSLLLIHFILKSLIGEYSDANLNLTRIPLAKLAEEFHSTIEKIKNAGIMPEQLQENLGLNLADPTPAKTSLLYRVYQQYQGVLSKQKMVSIADKVRAIPEVLQQTPQKFRTAFPRLKLFVWMGFDLFSVTMYPLLKLLTEQIDESHILLEYDESRPEVFEHLTEPAKRLTAFATEVIRDSNSLPELPAEKVGSLFYREPEKIEITRIEEFNVGLIIGKNPADEVEEICRWIKQLALRDSQVQLDQICVCFPNLEDYLPLIRRTFTRFGIPYSTSYPESLSRSLFWQTISALLNVVTTNYERRAMIKFFHSPYVSTASTYTDNHILALNRGLLLEIANFYRIVEDKQHWLTALATEEKKLAEQITNTAIESGREELDIEYKDISPEKAQWRLKQVQDLKAKLELFFNLVATLEQKQTLAEFIIQLQRIITELQLPVLASKYWEDQLSQKDFIPSDADTGLSELEAIKNLKCFFASIIQTQNLFTLDTQLTPLEFSQLLDILVSSKSSSSSQNQRSGVQVLGKLDLRGIEFDYIIIGGLIDTAFPKLIKPGVLLDESQRIKLRLVPAGELTLSEDLYLFHNYIRQARKQLICAYPQSKNEKRLLPSMVIEELKRIARVEEIELSPETALYSFRDLQKNFGTALRQKFSRGNNDKPPAELESWLADTFPPFLAQHLLKSILMTLAREQTPDFTEYEGVLNDPSVKEDLQQFANKVFSVSRFETYGRCPFAFFCSYLLDLEPLIEFEEGISPLDRGKVIHKILFRFYKQLKAQGKIPIDNKQKFDSALAELKQIAEAELGKLSYRGAFWEVERDNILGSTKENIGGLLEAFLKLEMKRLNNPDTARFLPAYFEVSFGMRTKPQQNDDISTAEPFILEHNGVQIKLQGRIDRIDLSDNAFIIYDYKTSTNLPNIKDVELGVSFQLPVYLLATEELLKKKLGKNFEPIGALYYVVLDQNNCEMNIFISPERYADIVEGITGKRKRHKDSDVFVNEVMSQIKQHIVNYLINIRNGNFVVRDINIHNRCEYCPYNKLCRADFIHLRANKRNLCITG
ncbi:MAG: exodeoxyribonuclease V subunit gamma [Candidatus Sumerlaeia bacterium]|nr:exodeoxyribonuclease V subunit gamma [Candidatus Sumerlaeia bacterium]